MSLLKSFKTGSDFKTESVSDNEFKNLGSNMPKKKSSKKKLKKIILGLFLSFLALISLGYFFIFLPAKEIYVKAMELKRKSQDLKSALKSNDLVLAKNALDNFEKDYLSFVETSQKIMWLKPLPFVGSYVKDYENALLAGEDFIIAGKKIIVAIEPHADLLGLKKGEASFSEKPVEERIKTAVYTLEKLKPDIDEISIVLDRANKRLEQIDINKYPEKLGKYVIRENIKAIKDQVLGFSELFVSAKPLLRNLPEILGSDRERTYLVLFQNDKELRATGGFLTSYAVFKIDKGNMRLEKSSDIYDLDNAISNHPKAPEKILKYHKGVSKFYIRDSNLSPDFVESIKLFESLYQKASVRVEYDGIIAIDTKVLVDLLEIFGDTKAQGVTFSARIDKRCDCPQAIYKLFDIIDRPTPYLRENRKGILGDLTLVLFQKAIGFSPSKYWGRLVNSMINNLEEKHILLYFVDPEIQKAVEQLNYAGRIRSYEGDYLHINDVNFAGAKSNMFVKHEVKSETFFEGDTVKRKLTITYRNPYKHSDCNLERGGLCLNATLRNWLRVYVPKGSKLISFKGSKTEVLTYEDLGKTVFEGFLTVTPQGKSVVIVEYELPRNLVTKDNYKILIQKQPGTLGHKYIVEADSKELFNGELRKDMELKLK